MEKEEPGLLVQVVAYDAVVVAQTGWKHSEPLHDTLLKSNGIRGYHWADYQLYIYTSNLYIGEGIYNFILQRFLPSSKILLVLAVIKLQCRIK